jgi:hypothetical protein
MDNIDILRGWFNPLSSFRRMRELSKFVVIISTPCSGFWTYKELLVAI